MSTQTGIRANDDLKSFFAKCRGENRTKYRMIKVVIANEELTLDMSKEASGDWKQDWDKLVLRSIESDEPCYLLYRYFSVVCNYIHHCLSRSGSLVIYETILILPWTFTKMLRGHIFLQKKLGDGIFT